MRNNINRILYLIIMLTWGLLPTLAGFLLFLRFIKSPHVLFHGAILTKWPRRHDGISLGLFIFAPEGTADPLQVHEFGHTLQALMLGPFYLIFVGPISLVWAKSKKYRRLRREKNIPYSACFVERWADNLGKSVIHS